MAILTDDCDIRDVRLQMYIGGNGDYYMAMHQYENGKWNSRKDYRMAMSGGNATHEVKMAFVALYRAMEAAGLNKHPSEDTH